MKRKLIFTYLVLLSCAISAQDEKIFNLNEITVTAGRFPVMMNELSRSVVIIDSSTIHSLPVNSIQDIFKYIGGVDLRTRGLTEFRETFQFMEEAVKNTDYD